MPTTPKPPTAAAANSPGQAASDDSAQPNSGIDNAGEPAPPATPPEQRDVAAWPMYTDDTYGFSISHPPYYTVKRLGDAERAQLSPSPLAAIYFQDQRNDLASIAPPQFSIRIFEKDQQQSLEDWLKATWLFNQQAGWIAESYTGKHASGIKLISPTFMAPGQFYYVTHGAFVFQLTPLGEEAEMMLDTLTGV